MPISLADYIGQTARGQNLRSRRSGGTLYLLNEVVLGSSYQQANGLVDVRNIDHVDVVRSITEGSKYGLRGVNTVIKIYTKTYVEIQRQRKERLPESRRSK